MGLFSRLGDIVNANINAMLDRAENPEKMVKLIIQEMEDTLVEVRSSAARAIAEKKALDRKIGQLNAAAEDWQRKAELALSKDREDLARGALTARARALDAATEIRGELDVIDEALAKTNGDMAMLQAKLDEAKSKQRSLEMRRKTAKDRVRMRHQLHDGRIDDALARYETLEHRLDALEAEAESYDLGKGRDLAAELADLETEDAVERELAELKARLADKS